jgi:hypothetical protein
MSIELKLRTEIVKVTFTDDNTTGYAVLMNDAPDDIQEPMVIAFLTEALAQEFATIAHATWNVMPPVPGHNEMNEFCELHEVKRPLKNTRWRIARP